MSTRPAAAHEFIAKDLPDDIQLIVGLETSTEFPFDYELHLERKYSVLIEEEWDITYSKVEPLLHAMYTNLFSQPAKDKQE